MHKILTIATFIFCTIFSVDAQHKFEFDGQISILGNYNPDNELDILLGGRYIPEINYSYQIDSTRLFEFDASANIYGSLFFNPFDTARVDGNIQPYRLWARYNNERFEIRVGLQKIDFGSATILRPLQWFNQIDPRDPLKLTNGVYGVLGKYYFKNNANIWLWGLYGNDKQRGFDAIKTYVNHPEFGGRFQFPVKRGEMSVAYHHRTADGRNIIDSNYFKKINEDRIGIDGKFDLVVGTWFEASYIRKSKDLGLLTHQTLMNLGVDYTFGLGNGLNMSLEHMILTYDEEAFKFLSNTNISASTLAYPLTMYDNLSAVLYYNWTAEGFNATLNYQHDFKKLTGHVIASYNSSSSQGIQSNNLVNSFTGPSIQLMLIYNH